MVQESNSKRASLDYQGNLSNKNEVNKVPPQNDSSLPVSVFSKLCMPAPITALNQQYTPQELCVFFFVFNFFFGVAF